MLVCALFEPFALWHACRLEPSLKEEPLVALEKNRVAHASKVARSLGVEAGVSIAGAHARCGDLVIINPNDATLQRAWDDVLAELYGFSDRLEPVGLGRVFLNVTETEARLIAETFGARVGGRQ